jgi:hypothetical protein
VTAVLIVTPLCLAQTVTVHLVDGKTGLSFSGKVKKVSLLGWSDMVPAPSSGAPGAWIAPGWRGGLLYAPLNAKGIATFDLPEARLPPTVCARADTPPRAAVACTRNSCFPTDLVLDSGVMTGDTCEGKKKIRAQFKPKPGEMIVFVRRHTFWDSLGGY